MLALVGKRNSSGDDANMARIMGQMEQDEVVARRLQVRLIMTRGLQTFPNIIVPFPTLWTGCKELFSFVLQIFVFRTQSDSYQFYFLILEKINWYYYCVFLLLPVHHPYLYCFHRFQLSNTSHPIFSRLCILTQLAIITTNSRERPVGEVSANHNMFLSHNLSGKWWSFRLFKVL